MLEDYRKFGDQDIIGFIEGDRRFEDGKKRTARPDGLTRDDKLKILREIESREDIHAIRFLKSMVKKEENPKIMAKMNSVLRVLEKAKQRLLRKISQARVGDKRAIRELNDLLKKELLDLEEDYQRRNSSNKKGKRHNQFK
jgi:hypothetical protein